MLTDQDVVNIFYKTFVYIVYIQIATFFERIDKVETSYDEC